MKIFLLSVSTLVPTLLMLLMLLVSLIPQLAIKRLWQIFIVLLGVSLAFTLIAVFTRQNLPMLQTWLSVSMFGACMAVIVQLLGTVIAVFSKRYLEGEPRQRGYIMALAAVLLAVHILLLANHWLVLIVAWSLVGIALQKLLCFYPDRPFALLAAHKKRVADRVADVLLIMAATLAWNEVGSGSLSVLWTHLEQHEMSTALQLCAVCLVLAVMIRTALLPVHGWLIQVMEAPTPVSALLHAGVVNLGGYVLILFAPLLEQALPARILLVAFGLLTAILAGMVMLTRISIKVRLAWSTVAQMGFMIVECGLGLYTLAALHLIGHSLYKAHSFLSASTVVRQTRLQAMGGTISPISISLFFAPVIAIPLVLLIQLVFSSVAWPWWWSVVLGLAWSPLLWLPMQRSTFQDILLYELYGALMIVGLTSAALVAHTLPLGLYDTPNNLLGVIVLMGMAMLYVCLGLLQKYPQLLKTWRRWSYAGFYMDEVYTRLSLKIWPTRWNP